MKIIFLDVDGVLNNDETFEEVHKHWKLTGYTKIEIDLGMVERLKRIVESTGAKIVLSSSWRLGWKLVEDGVCIPYTDCSSDIKLNSILSKYGLSVYSKTKVLSGEERGEEIKEWLSRHNDVESFVILEDDVCDMLDYYEEGRVVKTSCIPSTEMVKSATDTLGLQEHHIEEAIKILERVI